MVETAYKYLGRGFFTQPAIKVRDAVLAALKKHGAVTRDELKALTGIPRTTLIDSLQKLQLDEQVIRRPLYKCTRGQPDKLWSLVDAEFPTELKYSLILFCRDCHGLMKNPTPDQTQCTYCKSENIREMWRRNTYSPPSDNLFDADRMED
jgi:hypothetical protein